MSKRLLLSSRDRIKPYVLVDDDLYDELVQHSWSFSSGYASAKLPSGKRVFMHRYITNAGNGEHVDHINRLKYDNRRCNLRVCTPAENARNKSKAVVARSSSEYVGVSRYHLNEPTRWVANLGGNDLGIYGSEQEAAYVRDQVAMQVYGEYAYLNFDYEASSTVAKQATN